MRGFGAVFSRGDPYFGEDIRAVLEAVQDPDRVPEYRPTIPVNWPAGVQALMQVAAELPPPFIPLLLSWRLPTTMLCSLAAVLCLPRSRTTAFSMPLIPHRLEGRTSCACLRACVRIRACLHAFLCVCVLLVVCVCCVCVCCVCCV